jgi:SpoVK/Ycf46/Vps4 family AAA+-type ATPase
VRNHSGENNGNGIAPTLTDCVRRMLIAHAGADDQAFPKAAEEYAFEERRRNHHAVAKDIEKILDQSLRGRTQALFPLATSQAASPDLPRDRERGLPLIDFREPQRTLDSLTLDQSTRVSIDLVIAENRQAEVLRTRGLRPSNKLLFCGPPGCGKTATAEALARELYLPLAVVRFESVVSSYLGETSANLAKVFEFARGRPVVMLFDEFDAIGRSRTDESEHGELKRVVNALLQLIDRFRGETVIVAATNHEGTLDSAIWRRFDEIVTFPKPDKAQIAEVLLRCLRQFGIEAGFNLGRFGATLVGMSHGDVEHIAVDALKQAVLSNEDQVTADRLHAAAARQRARLQTSGIGKPKGNGRKPTRSRG